jgi:hypothetical protein
MTLDALPLRLGKLLAMDPLPLRERGQGLQLRQISR